MSVRRRVWRDPITGASKERWMIDVEIQHRDGRKERVRQVAPIQTKRGAEQYEREVRQSVLERWQDDREEAERKTPIEAPCFDAFADDFVKTYAATNNKPSEVESKEMILRVHLKPAFAATALDEIGLEQIEKYKARKRGEGLSPKTINNHLTVLHKLLSVANEWGKLSVVPRVRWLEVPKPKFRFLSFEEADRLVAAAQGQLRVMILLGLKTGLRHGELLALRWEDIDLVAGRLMVERAVARGTIGTPKNGRTREVPLSEVAVRALKAHRHLRGELVFTDEAGEMLTRNECRRPLWNACRSAGLRRIGWHSLRHTFASHLVMRGVPIRAVQELLGHATIEMTMRYAHLSPDVGRNAVRLLDAPAPSYGTRTAHEDEVDANPAKFTMNR